MTLNMSEAARAAKRAYDRERRAKRTEAQKQARREYMIQYWERKAAEAAAAKEAQEAGAE